MKRNKATYEGMRQVLCSGRKSPAAFKVILSLNNGYVPVMRQVLKIYPGQMERNKAIYEGMRQVFCASCKKPTTFKPTLSLKNGCALDTKNLP